MGRGTEFPSIFSASKSRSPDLSPCPCPAQQAVPPEPWQPAGHSQDAGTRLPADQTLAALPTPSTGQHGKELAGEMRGCRVCGQAHWAQSSRTEPVILVPWSGRWDQEQIRLRRESGSYGHESKQFTLILRGDLWETLWCLYTEREAALCSALIGVQSVMMCWSLSSSFPCWVLEKYSNDGGRAAGGTASLLPWPVRAQCILGQDPRFLLSQCIFPQTGSSKHCHASLRGCWALVVLLGKAGSFAFTV